jgi:hypothetical protein
MAQNVAYTVAGNWFNISKQTALALPVGGALIAHRAPYMTDANCIELHTPAGMLIGNVPKLTMISSPELIEGSGWKIVSTKVVGTARIGRRVFIHAVTTIAEELPHA